MATSPGLRRAFRAIAKRLNPAVLLMAGRGWMPIVGVIHHRGRRSGRTYFTPVMLRALGDHTAWYRNLETAGSAEVTYLGRRLTVGEPALVSFQDAANAFPRYERLLFRVLGITDFVRLRSGTRPVDPPADRVALNVPARSMSAEVKQASYFIHVGNHLAVC